MHELINGRSLVLFARDYVSMAVVFVEIVLWIEKFDFFGILRSGIVRCCCQIDEICCFLLDEEY